MSTDSEDLDAEDAGGLTAEESAYQELRGLLDAMFRQPFAEYDWASRRTKRQWSLREGRLDALAGPLTAIADRGECDYVYRDDERWPHVQGAEDFRVWARQEAQALRADRRDDRGHAVGGGRRSRS